MIRVLRLPPWAGIFVILGILALIVASIPLFLFTTGVFVLTSLIRNALFIRSSTYTTPDRHVDKDVSQVIENKQIGAYRIKADEHDPSVIEVVDP
jgi:hypothetical protein